MELVLPSKKYLKSYIEAIEENQVDNVETYPFFEADKYDIFEAIENLRTGKNLPDGYVNATYLWLVDGDAQNNLAELFYETGTVVEKDLEKAKEWYKKAAMNGHKEALEKYHKIGVIDI